MDIVLLNHVNPRLEEINIMNWRFVKPPPVAKERRWGDGRALHEFDGVATRIVIIDLLDLGYEAKVPATYGEVESVAENPYQGRRILQLLGVEAYMDGMGTLWRTNRPTLMILMKCEEFIDRVNSNSRLPPLQPGTESDGDHASVQRMMRAQMRRDNFLSDTLDLQFHFMWRDDDNEVRRLFDAIEDLQTRAAAIKTR